MIPKGPGRQNLGAAVQPTSCVDKREKALSDGSFPFLGQFARTAPALDSDSLARFRISSIYERLQLKRPVQRCERRAAQARGERGCRTA